MTVRRPCASCDHLQQKNCHKRTRPQLSCQPTPGRKPLRTNLKARRTQQKRLHSSELMEMKHFHTKNLHRLVLIPDSDLTCRVLFWFSRKLRCVVMTHQTKQPLEISPRTVSSLWAMSRATLVPKRSCVCAELMKLDFSLTLAVFISHTSVLVSILTSHLLYKPWCVLKNVTCQVIFIISWSPISLSINYKL